MQACGGSCRTADGAAGSGEPLRVLFADDDEATRALIRVLLGFVDGVEIVGEAEDGLEAVRLAQETRPQLVILDVRMPRLDGLAAAEALLAANPGVQLVVHTSEPESARLRQAERLGIRINNKADPDGLVRQVEAAAARAAEAPSAQNRLHTAVLAALLGSAPGQALVVATPEGEIPFYNQAAAEFLHWPFPPQTRLLAEWREHLPAFAMTGKRLHPGARPISRALATRSPAPEQELVVLRDGAPVPVIIGAVPLFGDDGHFLGAASYFRTTEAVLDGAFLQALSRRLPGRDGDGATPTGGVRRGRRG